MFYPLSRWVCFGKLDCSDAVDFDFEVTEEEHQLLQKYDAAGQSLSEVPELVELYNRALDESSEVSQKEMQSNLEADEEDDTDYYDYHVNFRSE